MSEILLTPGKGKIRALVLSFLVLIFCSRVLALDKQKYISLDEISPGMEGYALSVYSGTKVEKFSVRVVSVVRGHKPGRNAIFVMGTDDRFIHTGPVQGCSGSPVYLDGRIAGALSFGWGFSKDPLYGVTPIDEMIEVGTRADIEKLNEPSLSYEIDFSKPISYTAVYDSINDLATRRESSLSGGRNFKCPLVTNLPSSACGDFQKLAGFCGTDLVSSVGSLPCGDVMMVPNFEPGSVLTVPLIEGDIRAAIVGTVTEVDCDKVYGFGHAFLGRGEVNLPMATGYVHTVVASVISSFKYGQAGQIVGALKSDQSTAVYGVIGEEAPLIPINVGVDMYNSPDKKVYQCKVAKDEMLTPILMQSVVGGAVMMQGELPLNHILEYSVEINIEGCEDLKFQNVSSGFGVYELMKDVVGSVALLMSNPYQRPEITGVDVEVKVVEQDCVARVWSVQASETKVKAGDKIEIDAVVESKFSEKKGYKFELQVPENIQPGKYEIMLGGSMAYLETEKKMSEYKFIANNFEQMLDVMRMLQSQRRDTLYCVFQIPNQGLSIEHAALNDLPLTKLIPLADNRRALRVKPIGKTIVSEVGCGRIVFDSKTLEIIVEE